MIRAWVFSRGYYESNEMPPRPWIKNKTIWEIRVPPTPGPLLLVVSVILLHPQVRDRCKWKLSREREREGRLGERCAKSVCTHNKGAKRIWKERRRPSISPSQDYWLRSFLLVVSMCAGMFEGNREIVTEWESQEERREYLSLAARRDLVSSSRHPVMTVGFEVAAKTRNTATARWGRVPMGGGSHGVKGWGGGRQKMRESLVAFY